ncbi:hypothetical protein ACVWVY_004731 [Bradyrhizobium sp. URHC0002]
MGSTATPISALHSGNHNEAVEPVSLDILALERLAVALETGTSRLSLDAFPNFYIRIAMGRFT